MDEQPEQPPKPRDVRSPLYTGPGPVTYQFDPATRRLVRTIYPGDAEYAATPRPADRPIPFGTMRRASITTYTYSTDGLHIDRTPEVTFALVWDGQKWHKVEEPGGNGSE